MNINKELFLKYVRNYILVVLLITILLLPVYYTIYASAKDIIIGNAQGNLDLVTEELDDRISRMQGFTDVVRDNEYVAKIAAMQGIPNIEDYYT